MVNRIAGNVSVEWLLAAPMILILGLSALQWGLLFFSRTSVEFALQLAAREGAQGNASITSVEAGLARGLIPLWGISVAGQPVDSALSAALTRLGREQASGAIAWRQISPTQESFRDWAVAARDSVGDPIPNLVEIPNDALQFRGNAVGAASGQTIRDANLLKLEMRYGVPLNVPLVAPLAVVVMEKLNGCGGGAAGIPLAWTCAFYRAPDANGKPQLRWPVEVVAMVRMQTPARQSGLTPMRSENPLALGGGSPSSTPSAGGSGSGVSGETDMSTRTQGGGAKGGAPMGSGAGQVSTGSGSTIAGDSGTAAETQASGQDATAGAQGTTSPTGKPQGSPSQNGSSSGSAGQSLVAEILSRVGSETGVPLSCPAAGSGSG